jgi:sugar phosphate isomerase/epimerase
METPNKSLDRVRLGISPLSWTNDVLHDLGDEIPLEQCLREASEIGYEGMELGRKFPKDPQVLRPKLAEYGLVLAAGWYSDSLQTGWKKNGPLRRSYALPARQHASAPKERW